MFLFSPSNPALCCACSCVCVSSSWRGVCSSLVSTGRWTLEMEPSTDQRSVGGAACSCETRSEMPWLQLFLADFDKWVKRTVYTSTNTSQLKWLAVYLTLTQQITEAVGLFGLCVLAASCVSLKLVPYVCSFGKKCWFVAPYSVYIHSVPQHVTVIICLIVHKTWRIIFNV